MFKTGDRIQVDKEFGKTVTATILEIDYRNGTNIAKVRRDDTGQEDIFAWNIYQDEISVRIATSQPTVTMTQQEFDRKIADATAEGYKTGYTVGFDECYRSEYKGLLE